MGKKHFTVASLTLLLMPLLASCGQTGGSAGSVVPSPSATTSVAQVPSSGSSTSGSGTIASSPTAAPGDSANQVMLKIAVKEAATAAPITYILNCQNGVPAAGSTLPTAEAACKRLIKSLDIIQPLQVINPLNGTDNATQQCTQEYGGPQEASVTGTVAGEPISRSFNLKDGCQISAWNAAKDILGSTAGAQ